MLRLVTEEEDQDKIAASRGRVEEDERKKRRHTEQVEEMERIKEHLIGKYLELLLCNSLKILNVMILKCLL